MVFKMIKIIEIILEALIEKIVSPILTVISKKFELLFHDFVIKQKSKKSEKEFIENQQSNWCEKSKNDQTKVDDLIAEYETISKEWYASIPDRHQRLAFMKVYASMLTDYNTLSQDLQYRVLGIKDRVLKMYKYLYASKNIAKREKNQCKQFIEQLQSFDMSEVSDE